MAIVAVLVLTAGCSRFGSAEEQARTTTSTTPSDTAASVSPASTTTAAPSPSIATPVGSSELTDTPAAPTPTPAGPRNAATAETDGLAVTVVAEDGPDYPSTPRFRIQVRLENRSAETAYYFLGQGDYAAIADHDGTVRWRSTDCNPTLDTYEISGGVAPLEPGEAVDVVVHHPEGPNQASDAGDPDCSLPDGGYLLRGFFPLCRRGAERETSNPGTFSCPDEDAIVVGSGALSITFGRG